MNGSGLPLQKDGPSPACRPLPVDTRSEGEETCGSPLIFPEIGDQVGARFASHDQGEDL